MPKYGDPLKYFSGSKSMKSPFVIVADTESLLKKWILVLMIPINHQQRN